MKSIFKKKPFVMLLASDSDSVERQELRTIKTGVMQLQTKSETMINKMRGVESQLSGVLTEVHDRVKRAELTAIINETNAEQTKMKNSIYTLAGKESVANAMSKLVCLERLMEYLATKDDLELFKD